MGIQQLLLALFLAFSPSSAFLGNHHHLVLSSTSSIALSSTSSTETPMPEVKVGDVIPDVTMTELVTGADKPVQVKLADLIKGKKVAIFGVPGACKSRPLLCV